MQYYYYFKMKNNHLHSISAFTEPVDTELNCNFKALTNEQTEFYMAHPTASIYEIERCELNPQEDLLEHYKNIKIDEINTYDISENVNGFYLGEHLVWLDKETRACLMNTLNSAEIIGREEINIWFSGIYVTLHINEARNLLATLEIYATDCYNVTELHKVQVNALETIEQVINFDITADYPERLRFPLE